MKGIDAGISRIRYLMNSTPWFGAISGLGASRQYPGENRHQVFKVAKVSASVRQLSTLSCDQYPMTVYERKFVGQVPAAISFLSCDV
jgi:hypothetical protein